MHDLLAGRGVQYNLEQDNAFKFLLLAHEVI